MLLLLLSIFAIILVVFLVFSGKEPNKTLSDDFLKDRRGTQHVIHQPAAEIRSVQGKQKKEKKPKKDIPFFPIVIVFVCIFIIFSNFTDDFTEVLDSIQSDPKRQPSVMLVDEAYTMFETRLSEDPVYQILFRDHPNDKGRFIREFASTYKREGEAGIFKKEIEMYVIMLVNHAYGYFPTAPDYAITEYIKSMHKLLVYVNEATDYQCINLIGNSRNYITYWKKLDNDIFVDSITSVPSMILASQEQPHERANPEEYNSLFNKLYDNMKPKLQAVDITADNYQEGRNRCRYSEVFYESLLAMSETDRSNFIRLLFEKLNKPSWTLGINVGYPE